MALSASMVQVVPAQLLDGASVRRARPIGHSARAVHGAGVVVEVDDVIVAVVVLVSVPVVVVVVVSCLGLWGSSLECGAWQLKHVDRMSTRRVVRGRPEV